jgi:hypothetical protein
VRLWLFGLRVRARQPAERIGAFLERHSVTLEVAAMLLMTVVVVGAVWSQDLWLNLLAEAIGIGWTVLIIDRLLKWREERRWRPSRHLLYADLLEMVNGLLEQVLPDQLWEHSGIIFYHYGERTVLLTRFPHEVTRDRLVPLIAGENNHVVARLVKAKQVVYETIMRSSFLIDPELRRRLLGFGAQVSALEHIEEATGGGPRSRQLISGRLEDIILWTLSIYEFLLQQADSHVTPEEYSRHLRQHLRDLNKRYGL